MKGIVLAGGTGSRLWPITRSVSKQLLPVYDKPLIHYPLGTLMLAGIREVLMITTEDDQAAFKKLLGSGEYFGMKISYEVQSKPEGLAQAFLIGAKFIGSEPVALILGDNIFHGMGLGRDLINSTNPTGALIFGYSVKDPERYGVAEFDKSNKVLSLEEKPKNPKSKYAIPGLYFFDNRVIKFSKSLKPSKRGELEIVDVMNAYLNDGGIDVIKFPRGTAWLDAGQPDSLFQSAAYVKTIQERQGIRIGCIEEECYNKGFINKEQLKKVVDKLPNSEYKCYLQKYE